MNARRIVGSLVFALLAAPTAALACTDGGPPNGYCGDAGREWIGCTDHAQCPEGQYCTAQGACGCGARDGGTCTDAGCHGCIPRPDPDAGYYCGGAVYFCPEPTPADAGTTTSPGVDGGTAANPVVDSGTVTGAPVDSGTTVDAGSPAAQPSTGGDGCSVGAPGRVAGSPLAVLAALVGVAALARVRRR